MNEFISFIEPTMARFERTIKRLWILCIILIITLIVTNVGWIYYESQFVTTETSIEQEVDTGEGNATVIGAGDYNGESKTDSNSTK